LLVKSSRLFAPGIQALAAEMARRGGVITASVRYAKGVRHNGTHALDLLALLFGPVIDARPLRRQPDWFQDDPSVSAVLRLQRCAEAYLLAHDERAFTLFEADILTDWGRIILGEDGLIHR